MRPARLLTYAQGLVPRVALVAALLCAAVLGTHATSKPKAPSLSIALAKCRKIRNRRECAKCETSACRRYLHRNKKEKG
jgi:phytoene/squalene synthetase